MLEVMQWQKVRQFLGRFEGIWPVTALFRSCDGCIHSKLPT